MTHCISSHDIDSVYSEQFSTPPPPPPPPKKKKKKNKDLNFNDLSHLCTWRKTKNRPQDKKDEIFQRKQEVRKSRFS